MASLSEARGLRCFEIVLVVMMFFIVTSCSIACRYREGRTYEVPEGAVSSDISIWTPSISRARS